MSIPTKVFSRSPQKFATFHRKNLLDKINKHFEHCKFIFYIGLRQSGADVQISRSFLLV